MIYVYIFSSAAKDGTRGGWWPRLCYVRLLLVQKLRTAFLKHCGGVRSKVPHTCRAGATMDLVLSFADHYFFNPYLYPASWPEDNIVRQTISLLIVTNLGAYILYFFCATLSYYFVYDHSLMKHPQFLKVRDFRVSVTLMIQCTVNFSAN